MDPETIAKRLRKIRRELADQLAEREPPKPSQRVAPEPQLSFRPRREEVGSGEPNLSSTDELVELNRMPEITEPIEITTNVPVVGPLIVALRRWLRPLYQAVLDRYLERQERFNIHLVRHLNEFGARAERRIRRAEEVYSDLEARLDAALDDYDSDLRARHTALLEGLEEEVLALQAMARDAARSRDEQVQELRRLQVERSQGVDRRLEELDRALAAVDRRVASRLDDRLSALPTEEIHALRNRMRDVLGRLEAVEAAATGGGDPGTGTGAERGGDAPEATGEPAGSAPGMTWGELRRWLQDEEYQAFQASFRGDEEALRERQRGHLERFEGIDEPVADLGCGRGGFVEMLQEAGHEALGVELNAADVEACRERGLDVVEADLFDWLDGREPASLGGIFLAQVIEHLPPPDWARLLELAAARLAPGGRLVVETINPESLYALVRAYVIDPTHVRPVHPSLLSFMAYRAGFEPVDVQLQAPVPADERPAALDEHRFAEDPELAELVREVNTRLDRLDRILCAPQEYTLTATWPGPVADAGDDAARAAAEGEGAGDGGDARDDAGDAGAAEDEREGA